MSGSNGYITKKNTIHIGNLTYAAIKRRVTEGGIVPSLPDEYCAGHNLIVESYGVDGNGCSYCDQTLVPGSYGRSSETSAYLVVPLSEPVPSNVLLHSQCAGVMLKYSATYDSCCCPYCTYCCVHYSDMYLTTDAVNFGCYKKFTLSRAPYTVYFCNTCTGKTCLGTMAGNYNYSVCNVSALILADTSVCAQGNNYIIVCCGGNLGQCGACLNPGTGTTTPLYDICPDCQIAIFGLSKSNTSNVCCCCCFGTNYII